MRALAELATAYAYGAILLGMGLVTILGGTVFCLLRLCKSLCQIGHQIFTVFNTDRQPQQLGADACCLLRDRGHGPVGHAGRMGHQTLHPAEGLGHREEGEGRKEGANASLAAIEFKT